MEENDKEFDDFFKILKEQEEKIASNLNQELFDDICLTANIVDKTEDKAEVKEITNKLIDRFRDVDLNKVTDLFIYNQMYFTTDEDPLPTPSVLCINIGKIFKEENLHYAATKVYSDDEVVGDTALSLMAYLALHEHHKSYVLSFLKENFEGFSHNKKTELVFQLKNYFPDDYIAQEIVENSGITEYRLIFSTQKDSGSKPITFKFNTDKIDNLNEVDKSSEDIKSTIVENKKENISSNSKNEKLKVNTLWWQFWKK